MNSERGIRTVASPLLGRINPHRVCERARIELFLRFLSPLCRVPFPCYCVSAISSAPRATESDDNTRSARNAEE